MKGLEILDTDEAHRHAVWKKLDRLRGAQLTHLDASSLVWIEQRKISTVAAHLPGAGAEGHADADLAGPLGDGGGLFRNPSPALT